MIVVGDYSCTGFDQVDTHCCIEHTLQAQHNCYAGNRSTMAELGLFAGLDAAGAIRFVADVPRGLACGCTCPGCGSPLVAKRGEVKVWHFAHEADQERPECLVGATNLLRRLAIELLQASPHISLPEYTATVQAGIFPRLVRRQVTWTPKCQVVSSWVFQPAHRAKVVEILTDANVRVAVYVDVATHVNDRDPDGARDTGEIHFLVPLPQPGQLRALSDALEHISLKGHFKWIYLPDVTNQVENAQQLADSEAEGLEREFQANVQRERKVRDEIQALRRLLPDPKSDHEPVASFATPEVRLNNPRPGEETPWAKWRKLDTSFLFYGLRDGTGWLIITHQNGELVAVPWPYFEGWNEALPERLGKADIDLGGIPMGANATSAMLYWREQLVAMRVLLNSVEI